MADGRQLMKHARIAGLVATTILTAASPTLAAGPTSRKYNDVEPPPAVLHSLPAVGEPREVTPGESMISSAVSLILPVLTLSAPVSTSGGSYRLTINPGMMRLVGRNEDGEFYEAAANVELKTFGVNQPAPVAGLFIPTDKAAPPETYWGGPARGHFAKPGEKHSVIVAAAPDARFERGTKEEITDQSLRRELVYNGVSQGTVTITYREFTNNYARPAFTQELKYDLGEGSEIGYRGARFRIEQANNLGLKYTVLKPLTAGN